MTSPAPAWIDCGVTVFFVHVMLSVSNLVSNLT
jgi:hypothetical protein